MIPSFSNRFNSLWREGRDTFMIIAHLEMDSGMATLSFPDCLACISSQKADPAGKRHSYNCSEELYKKPAYKAVLPDRRGRSSKA